MLRGDEVCTVAKMVASTPLELFLVSLTWLCLKWLGVSLDGMLVHCRSPTWTFCQVTLMLTVCCYLFILWVKRSTMRVKCFPTQEHNAMTLNRNLDGSIQSPVQSPLGHHQGAKKITFPVVQLSGTSRFSCQTSNFLFSLARWAKAQTSLLPTLKLKKK